MSTEHRSVVVVGGGPAGATAAFTLASLGVDVCVVDKRHFPRDKLCGGLLTLRSKEIFEKVYREGWEECVHTSASGVRFFDSKHTEPIAEELTHSRLFFTQRYNFDDILMRRALSAGAKAKLGVGVSQIDFANKEVTLSDESVLAYDYLVGADGVNSVVARTMFTRAFDQRTIGFALEVDVPATAVRGANEFPEIHFGFARWGYGWVFPKKGSYTIGLGGIHEANPDLMERLNSFLRHRIGFIPQQKVKGHFLPFGDFRQIPGKDAVLLCGDAAGLVDSITGEGIAFAMQSGNEAATAIASVLRAGAGDALATYQTAYSGIIDHIRQSNRYRWFIFPKFAQGLFLLALPDASTIQRGYLDLIAGKIEYDALPGLMWIQFKKGVIKIARTIMRSILPRSLG